VLSAKKLGGSASGGKREVLIGWDDELSAHQHRRKIHSESPIESGTGFVFALQNNLKIKNTEEKND